MSPAERQHHFECRFVWTGAAQGGTKSYDAYSREGRVDVPGKSSIRMSAAPVFRGDPKLSNPEDLLVASLSACHFLSYAALCARNGVTMISYEDDASGTMSRFEGGFHFTDVVLKPKVTIAGGSDPEKAMALHAKAHEECFIASSVNFPVRHEPTVSVAAGSGH
jgi:organic hydroperoxide reductase OsmC/OhrA